MNKMGFGFLRPPLVEGGGPNDVDLGACCRLVDAFLERGGTFFDTAHTYLEGASEAALRACLVERHPRGSFQIADKLPGWQVRSEGDNERYFEESLQRCGVDFFDAYLIHWLTAESYETAERFGQFEFLQRLKEEGLVGKTGFSFHDTATVLERILREHPEIDYVTLQVNYLDWESEAVQSRLCVEACARHGKPVVVMEPLKGGTLAVLPPDAAAELERLDPHASPARWGLRFVQGLEQVAVCLSGMNGLSQVEENMADVEPLSALELAALWRARDLVLADTAVPCTGCGYCQDSCPVRIPIPRYLSLVNEHARDPEDDWKLEPAYRDIARGSAPASECLGCRRCEGHCPQRIEVSAWMRKAAEVFEG